MKTTTTTLNIMILVFCTFLFCSFPSITQAQQPVPGNSVPKYFKQQQEPVPVPDAPVPVTIDAQEYFAGATDNDKEFIDAVMQEANKRGIKGFRKWRLQRRLHQKNFVKAAQQEIAAQMYWDNPTDLADSAITDPAGIDWSNIDWDKVFNIILQLLELFSKFLG